MLENIKISTILFLDIETAPVVYNYNALDENIKQLWDTKFRYQQSENPETQYKKAGIYAEFSKVICISVGFFNEGTFRIKSFYGHDEKQLLQEFATLLNTHFNRKENLLCAHNGKEFDFPFLCRRMLINTVKLPKALNISGKKPWEVNHLDTMELWKFGDYKNYSSLSLLATIFNIPTPKDDINGADVARVYWEEKNLERIVTYCQKDVLTVAQLLLRFMGEPLIEDKNIIQAELNVFSS
ncbi:MAG: 3'-5' exonuclease [Bacteroidetes bacterium RIFCSPLOWO2_12_FULL_35_15]|nr:MAG: 3'-5' exonuclease [Bacteroidetes bacterium RIFCSPLOWO2_12_FULL_35_15]